MPASTEADHPPPDTEGDGLGGSYDPRDNLVVAAATGDLAGVRRLVTRGAAAVPEKVGLPATRSYVTPLQMALHYQHVDIARLLIDSEKLCPDFAVDHLCRDLLTRSQDLELQVRSLHLQLRARNAEVERLKRSAEERRRQPTPTVPSRSGTPEVERLQRALTVAEEAKQRAEATAADHLRLLGDLEAARAAKDQAEAGLRVAHESLAIQTTRAQSPTQRGANSSMEDRTARDAALVNAHRQVEAAVQSREELRHEVHMLRTVLDGITANSRREALAAQRWYIVESSSGRLTPPEGSPPSSSTSLPPVLELTTEPLSVARAQECDPGTSKCLAQHRDCVEATVALQDYLKDLDGLTTTHLEEGVKQCSQALGVLLTPAALTPAAVGACEAIDETFRQEAGLVVDPQRYMPTNAAPSPQPALVALSEQLEGMLRAEEVPFIQEALQSQLTKLNQIATLLSANNMQETKYAHTLQSLMDHVRTLFRCPGLPTVLHEVDGPIRDVEDRIREQDGWHPNQDEDSAVEAINEPNSRLKRQALLYRELLGLLRRRLVLVETRQREVDVVADIDALRREVFHQLQELSGDVRSLRDDCKSDQTACRKVLREHGRVVSPALHPPPKALEQLRSGVEKQLRASASAIQGLWEQIHPLITRLREAHEQRSAIVKRHLRSVAEHAVQEARSGQLALAAQRHSDRLSVLIQRCSVAQTLFGIIQSFVEEGTTKLQVWFKNTKLQLAEHLEGLHMDFAARYGVWRAVHSELVEQSQRNRDTVAQRMKSLEAEQWGGRHPRDRGTLDDDDPQLVVWGQLRAQRDALEVETTRLEAALREGATLFEGPGKTQDFLVRQGIPFVPLAIPPPTPHTQGSSLVGPRPRGRYPLAATASPRRMMGSPLPLPLATGEKVGTRVGPTPPPLVAATFVPPPRSISAGSLSALPLLPFPTLDGRGGHFPRSLGALPAALLPTDGGMSSSQTTTPLLTSPSPPEEPSSTSPSPFATTRPHDLNKRSPSDRRVTFRPRAGSSVATGHDVTTYQENRKLKKELLGQGVVIPPGFVDPITLELMVDPVVAADDHTYDRESLLRWFAKSDKSPVTGVGFSSKDIRPNDTLRTSIAVWRHKEMQTLRAHRLRDTVL